MTRLASWLLPALLLIPGGAIIDSISAPADGGAPAVRLDPVVPDYGPIPDVTTTTVPAYGPNGQHVPYRCPEWEYLLVQYAPAGGWDVPRMSGYLWRESGCDPTVRSSTSDTSLAQINDVNIPYLNEALGEYVDRYTLLDPVQNIRAAAALCEYWRNDPRVRNCYQPWKRQ